MPDDGLRRDHPLPMEVVVLDGQEATRMPLERRPSGITAFQVGGSLDTSAVRAIWDGRWVTASPVLARRLALAMAVDDVFLDAGLTLPLGGGRRSGPEELLLALLDCCDSIDVLEYELHGHRRVISWNP